MDTYATARQRVLGNYFDERRTTLFGSEVKLKKHTFMQSYHSRWLDLVLVECAGDDPGNSTRDVILLPHATKAETSESRPGKAISLGAVQYAFRQQECEMTAVYPDSARYTVKFGSESEMACWKAEIHQAQHITFDDYSEFMFHIVTIDDSPFHAILKTSRIDPTALVAVDPINFREIQVWAIPSLISLTVEYTDGVSLTFLYQDSTNQEFIEDEIRLYSRSPVVLSEVKPFLDNFLKLRLGDMYLDTKIEYERFNPEQSAVPSCISEYAMLKYKFPHAGKRAKALTLPARSPVTVRAGRLSESSEIGIPAPRPVKSPSRLSDTTHFGTVPHSRSRVPIGTPLGILRSNSLEHVDDVNSTPKSIPLPKAIAKPSPSQRRLPPKASSKLPPANLVRPGVAPER